MAEVLVCPRCRRRNTATAAVCTNPACGYSLIGLEVIEDSDTAVLTGSASPAPKAALRVTQTGTTRARAELRSVGEHEQCFEIAPGAEVGRGANVDLSEAPDSQFISRRHARFATRDDRWYIEPLGSTNSTFVDGVVVQGPRALDSGETVMLGRTQFVFKILE